MSKYEMVVKFYNKTQQVHPDKPKAIPAARRAQLMAYLMSEVLELGNSAELTDQVDAATDLLYFVMDVFVELGVDPDVPFNIVHEANMDKVWPHGKPLFDYNVVPPRMLKPEGWVAPEPSIKKWLEDKMKYGS